MGSIEKEEDQLDIFKFLSDGPKIIKEFRESELFYVKEYDRGVYPRSLLNMLEDLGIVVRFRPYKSTEEEIEAFSEELNAVSPERKEILERYVSWRLTPMGKQVYEESEDLKNETQLIVEETSEDEGQEQTQEKVQTPEESEKDKFEEKSMEDATAQKVETEMSAETKKEEIEAQEPEKVHENQESESKVPSHKKRAVEQNVSELSLVEERDERDVVEEEIKTKKEKIKQLQERREDLGLFDRSEKKEIDAKIEDLKEEIRELQSYS